MFVLLYRPHEWGAFLLLLKSGFPKGSLFCHAGRLFQDLPFRACFDGTPRHANDLAGVIGPCSAD